MKLEQFTWHTHFSRTSSPPLQSSTEEYEFEKIDFAILYLENIYTDMISAN